MSKFLTSINRLCLDQSIYHSALQFGPTTRSFWTNLVLDSDSDKWLANERLEAGNYSLRIPVSFAEIIVPIYWESKIRFGMKWNLLLTVSFWFNLCVVSLASRWQRPQGNFNMDFNLLWQETRNNRDVAGRRKYCNSVTSTRCGRVLYKRTRRPVCVWRYYVWMFGQKGPRMYFLVFLTHCWNQSISVASHQHPLPEAPDNLFGDFMDGRPRGSQQKTDDPCCLGINIVV